MSDYSPYFRDESHALAVGLITGALMKNHEDGLIQGVAPFMDAQRNYTNQIHVTVNGKSYTLTVEDSLDEVLRQDEAGDGAED